LWYAASSQNSPAIYLLLFGLTAVFLVSIPHTLLNLAGVTIATESAKPAFAGQEVSLPVEIMNCSRATRRGIQLVLPTRGGGHKRSLEKAMTLQVSAPMCRANLNVTSIGEPWRADSHS